MDSAVCCRLGMESWSSPVETSLPGLKRRRGKKKNWGELSSGAGTGTAAGVGAEVFDVEDL